MVLTNNEYYYEQLKLFRHHEINKDLHLYDLCEWEYDILNLGYNYRLTDFQCALGISQLKKLDRFIETRREIAKRYNEAFSTLEGVKLPQENAYSKSAYHLYVIQLETGKKAIFEALRKRNIGVAVHYIPLHYHYYYHWEFGYRKGDFPIAERYYESAITLPLFPGMSDKDIEDVIEATCEAISN